MTAAVSDAKRAGGSTAHESCASDLMAAPTRVLPATPWHPPCLRMTCIWSGARSNTIAHGASFPPDPRNPTPWSLSTVGQGAITPNLRATQIELYDGLKARSQNRFPSLRFDLGASAAWVAPLLSAGFYYKSFMWPPSFWKRVYEPLIRRAAGLGRAPTASRPRSVFASIRPLRSSDHRRRPCRFGSGTGRFGNGCACYPVRRASGTRRIAAG